MARKKQIVMRKFFLLLVLALSQYQVFSQNVDSVCTIPIYKVVDTTLFDIIDTLICTEKAMGIYRDDSCTITISFINDEGNRFIVECFYDKPTHVLSTAKEHFGGSFYKKHYLSVYGHKPSNSIMTPTNDKRQIDCISFPNESPEEDDGILESPHATILGECDDKGSHIVLKMDWKGNILR